MPNTSRMQWPYPSENQDPWYDGIEAFFSALDASGYAGRENDQVILSGGGNITFNATSGVVAWDAAIDIISAYTGYKWSIAAGQLTLDDGKIAYVTLSRSPSKNLTITAVVADQLPVSDNTLLFCIRNGIQVYFRNGASVKDGATISPISGSDATVTAGEANTASNVGTGSEVFKQKTALNFEFRTLFAGYNIAATQGSNDVTFVEDTTVTTLTSTGGNIAIDADVGSKYDVELTEVTTELNNPSNLAEGQHFEIHIKQDGTGSRALTFDTEWISIDGITTSIASSADAVTVLRGHARNLPNGPGLRVYYTLEHGEESITSPVINSSVQTVDATVTTIATYATSVDDAIYVFDVSFAGIDKVDNHVYERGMRAVVLRDEVSTVTVKNVDNYSTYKDDVTWDTTIDISGTSVRLRVQGDATNAVKWNVKGDVVEHS